ncbi:MAG: hypothetical protein HY343_01700, partial [Lentisphaerae bacterium]|nr:hypothetical protein [Lentisphaerota bacterium]
DWLEVGRVLECAGLEEGRRGWGRAYEAYLEACCEEWATEAGRKELTKEWKEIRRGWCLGGEDFREKLLDAVGERLKGKKRETYGGEERAAHDERAASDWLEKGLARLDLTQERLRALKKGDKRKQAMAWWLKRQTSVGADWIAGHLVMGYRTSVSQANRLVEQGDDPELNRLKRKLEKTPRLSD